MVQRKLLNQVLMIAMIQNLRKACEQGVDDSYDTMLACEPGVADSYDTK